MADGLVEEAASGIFLTAIESEIRADRDRITLVRLEAQGSKGGSLTGQGVFDLTAPYVGSARISLSELSPLQREDLMMVVSGQVDVGSHSDGLQVDGDLTINEALLDLGKLHTNSYATLDVDFDQPDRAAPSPQEPLPLNANIQIRAPNRLKVVGQGVDAEWGMDTVIRLDPELGLTGRIFSVRGHIDFIGKRFEVQPSSVVFNGPATRLGSTSWRCETPVTSMSRSG